MNRTTTKSCGSVSTPSHHANGIENNAIARPMSLTISTGRRRRRSTMTPAGSPTRRKGANSTALSAATAKVLALRVLMASNGMARRLTWLPSSLTDSALQSRTKSALRSKDRSATRRWCRRVTS